MRNKCVANHVLLRNETYYFLKRVPQLNKFKMAKAIGSLPENVNFGIKASTVKQFLNTSGLPTKWSERKEAMSNQELSKIAAKQTVMVVCHRD